MNYSERDYEKMTPQEIINELSKNIGQASGILMGMTESKNYFSLCFGTDDGPKLAVLILKPGDDNVQLVAFKKCLDWLCTKTNQGSENR